MEMHSLLASCRGNPLASSLCGYIFEPYAMDMLEKGGTFKCRELVGGRQGRRSISEIDVPASSGARVVADRVEEGQTPNQLYVPKTSNYTAIDAWMPGFGGFQMTVGKRHEIKGGADLDLGMLGDGGNCLYWVLPPLYFYDFTKKTPQSINQFALMIPYPTD